MFADVLTALRRAPSIDEIVVVTSDHGAQRLAGGHGATIVEDHGRRAQRGRHRRDRGSRSRPGPTRVLLRPRRLPAARPEELDALLGHPAGERSALIIPDRHGTGTNALLLSPPDVLTPSFGIDSCQRHARLAVEQAHSREVVQVRSLALDVDTPEDLVALRETLAGLHGGAAHTRGMLNQLMRSRA